jgi:hypothetical protein
MEKTVLSGQTLIVLGKGLSGNPKKGETVELTIHSKLNAIAAGLLFYHYDKFETIVFTGGHTKGENEVSEAQAMKIYLLHQFPDIPAKHVLVESKSIDTLGNITELLEHKFIAVGGTANILSVSQHLRRSKILFRNIARIKARMYSSQDVIQDHGNMLHMKMLSEFRRSSASVMESIKEFILNVLVIFDPKGKRLRKITSRTRT